MRLVTQNMRGLIPEKLELIIHTIKDRGIHAAALQEAGELFPRDVTMTRLTVFLSFGKVRQYAPATAAGWG